MILKLVPLNVRPRSNATFFAIPEVDFDLDWKHPIVVLEGEEFFELVGLRVAGSEQLIVEPRDPFPCSWLKQLGAYTRGPYEVCPRGSEIALMVRNVTDDEHRFAAELHGSEYVEPF